MATTPDHDLIFDAAHAGWHIRHTRTRLGLSLRQLEKMSGVNDSEIHKVESGQQECRLDSFVRICAALGQPAGRILDDIQTSNLGLVHRAVLKETAFSKLKAELRIPEKCSSEIATSLAVCGVVAVRMIRCSNAVRLARLLRYPHPDLGTRFSAFAAKLDTEENPADRSSILHALMNAPIAELSRLDLLSAKYLASYVSHLATPKKERAVPTMAWGASVLEFPAMTFNKTGDLVAR